MSKANSDVAEIGGDPSFEATDVHIITWDGVVINSWYYSWSYYYYHGGQQQTCTAQNHGNTFQLVIIADADKTYIQMNYEPGKIRVPYHRWWYHYHRNLKFGYQFPDRDPFQGNSMSGNPSMSYIDRIPGNRNDNKIGSWMFRLFETTTGGQTVCKAAEQKCRKWAKNTVKIGKKLSKLVPPCPCNSGHAMLDNTFRIEDEKTNYWHYYSVPQVCFVSRKTYSRYIYKNKKKKENEKKYHSVRQSCCYRRTWFRRMCTSTLGCFTWFNGPLITQQSNLSPGHIKFLSTSSDDDVGHNYCCKMSNKFCHLFYKRRPVDDCSAYIPPTVRITWGDPHIKTLDGVGYTFNGHGEYIMVDTEQGSSGFQLQARTERALDRDDQPTDATVFSAFAASDNETSTVQVQMSDDKQSLELYDDSTSLTTSFIQDSSQTSITLNGGVDVVKNGTNVVLVAFQSGWTFVVSLGARMLTIQVGAPPDALNYDTKGLLGNINNDPSDDLTSRNGTQYPNTTDEETLFNNFGQTWMITEPESIFHYVGGTSWSDHRDPTFVPVFNPCNTEQLRTDAEAACGGAGTATETCKADYCLTLDDSVAAESAGQERSYNEENSARENKNPNITICTPMLVTMGVNYQCTITAVDGDGDDIFYEMTGNFTGTATFNTVTQQFSWTPSSVSPVDIGFIATDNKGGSSPTAQPLIVMCSGCSSQGSCDFNQYLTDGRFTSFALAKCNCDQGYEGTDCNEQFDGCADNPCEDLGTDCTDLTPEEEEENNGTARYRCECPTGFISDNNNCVDIDECLSGTDDCPQVCVNTLGSFRCECSSGYRKDGEICKDVDECTENTHECEQLCTNTVGSYDCDCDDEFNLDPNQRTCNQDPSTVCNSNTNNCNQICVKQSNTITCRCYAGYRLDTDSITCKDIDECAENTHACSDTCNNTVGKYECSCPAGYQLKDDSLTCEECEEGTWGWNCDSLCICSSNFLTCGPVVGCTGCRPGWGGDNCDEDVDECWQDPTICEAGPGKRCVNTQGSYTCTCQDGYIEDLNGNCLSDPDPDPEDFLNVTSSPTLPPSAEYEDKLEMRIRISNMEYHLVYSNMNDSGTVIQSIKITAMLDDVYYARSSTEYVGVKITEFSNGSLLVDYDILFAEILSPFRKAVYAAALIHAENVMFSGETYIISESSVKLPDGSYVLIEDQCSLLTALKTCQSGECELSDDGSEPSCKCDEGASGEYCDQAPVVNTAMIIGVSVASGLVAIIIIIVTIYFIKRKMQKKKVAPSGEESRPVTSFTRKVDSSTQT